MLKNQKETTEGSKQKLISESKNHELEQNYPNEQNDNQHANRDSVYLAEKVSSTIQFIKDCCTKYGIEHLSISFNGGKDCTVLLYLCLYVFEKYFLQKESKLMVIYVVENEPFREIQEFVADCGINHPQLSISLCKGKLKNAFQEYLHENPTITGILDGTRHSNPFAGIYLNPFFIRRKIKSNFKDKQRLATIYPYLPLDRVGIR